MYDGGVKGYAPTAVAADEKIDTSKTEVAAYEKYLAQRRGSFKKWAKEKTPSTDIVEEYSLTLNGFAVKASSKEIQKIKSAPGVVQVAKSIQYRPQMNKSHSIIKDTVAWRAGYLGEGMKIAVIDSGIDQNHPYLTDESLSMPEGFPKGDTQFTSNKVIVAKVFSPEEDVTPEAIGSHGTHVAGTIAGIQNYVDPSGAAKSKLSGVAPKAYLGNYNVFPCDDCSAESIYIASAIEQAVRDGMDVANMSLGGPAEPGFDMLAEVVNAASDAGMTMVISAGNNGPGQMTIGSPGTADNAITVAAVSNKHFFGTSINVTIDGETRTLPVGSSNPGGAVTEAVDGPLHIVTDGEGMACEGISEDLSGKIAVIKRGACTFTTKALAAQEQGAIGVILITNAEGDPSGMFVEEEATIPMVMVTIEDGEWITSGAGSALFEPMDVREFLTDNDRQIARFSSRGPTVNYTLKPDVAAVGVNVYSSVVGGGLSSYNGTSMSAPHVAGAAALLQQAHPNWTPQQIKSALIGTAYNPKSDALPLEVGGGIIHVGRALLPAALAEPASLSFGKVTAADRNKIKVNITNTSGFHQQYRIKTDSADLELSKQKIKVKRNKTASFTVKVSGEGKELGKDYQGYITLVSKYGRTIRIPYYFHAGE
ncbi:S8 family serine peptidase [Mechercharimyces sp. CAU 1602]|nr:S8 family serine peptidase [Mechercharimyces sp. CAU 1602]